MSSFNKKRMSANNIKWIVTFVLIAMLTLAVIFAFVKIDKNQKTKELDTSVFTYSIGLIDAEGEYEQGTSSIYTKNYYTVDGLVCELDEDATITYSIVFYNADKEYIDTMAGLKGNYDGTENPVNSEYFRIMITPTNDAEVSFFEIGTYADQLTVTINK